MTLSPLAHTIRISPFVKAAPIVLHLVIGLGVTCFGGDASPPIPVAPAGVTQPAPSTAKLTEKYWADRVATQTAYVAALKADADQLSRSGKLQEAIVAMQLHKEASAELLRLTTFRDTKYLSDIYRQLAGVWKGNEYDQYHVSPDGTWKQVSSFNANPLSGTVAIEGVQMVLYDQNRNVVMIGELTTLTPYGMMGARSNRVEYEKNGSARKSFLIFDRVSGSGGK